MDVKELVNRATSEIGRATERARRVEQLVDGKIAQAGKLAAMAVGHIEHATALVKSATATMNRVLPLLDGAVVERGLAMLGAAAGKLIDSKVALVKEAAAKLAGAVGGLRKAFTALTGLGGKAPAPVAAALSSLGLKPKGGAAGGAEGAAATAATPHMLVLSAEDGSSYSFGLSNASFQGLKRQTNYTVAAQERLNRQDALQAVGKGGESLSLNGVIFTALNTGRKELDKLRAIGQQTKPLLLTTGYGEVLGRWYMVSLSEEQDGLLANGAARKQTFSMEFKRYGDDYQNL
ncbi:phage tail protein [Rugamonas sp. CCM 8940]|uniref:phage tail protein n=1 Tax=Rugamonas sp. CCM 8940 TaxID=2765359 RepID=UPI0018F5B9A5|nr:phage tail protein [Rugamonas sp. CCM 8940]MBJ7309229.1 phage tail protein [Rugamonas sp. CCM 8940]